MSADTRTSQAPARARLRVLIVLCCMGGVLWTANWFFLSKYIPTSAERSEFGEMFGAVNALFTALAFAGLIYTVLLQRDQLALQQRELLESGRTQRELVRDQIEAQKELFNQQKVFQLEQQANQNAHDLKLENLRQEFEQILNERQKAREDQRNRDFQKNLLQAFRRELDVIGRVYDEGIGAQLAKVEPGQFFTVRLGLTQDWFTVFNTNAGHLGKLDAHIAEQIVTVYILLKALVEEFRINNECLTTIEQIRLEMFGNPENPMLIQRQQFCIQQLLRQVEKLKTVEARMRHAVSELLSTLDRLNAR